MSENRDTQSRPPQGRAGGGMGGPPGMAMGAPVQKARDFKGTMIKLLEYIKVYQSSILIVIIFAVLSTIFSIVGPKILGKATTKLVEGMIAYYMGTGLYIDFAYIRMCVIALVILYLASFGFSYIQGWIMSDVAMKITYQFRKDISLKMNRMPLKYFDTRTHGDVLSRVTNDVDTVNQTLNQSLTQLITSAVTVVGILIMMLTISWQLTLIALLVVPLSGVAVMLVVKQSQGYFKEQQGTLGKLNGHVEEMFGGHNVVQAFNGEKESVEIFQKYNHGLYSSAWKSQFLSGLMMPIMMAIGNFGYVLVCMVGGYLAAKRLVEVGDIQAFIQYMRQFTQPITQLATISNTLQSTAAAAERVFEFLAEEEEVPEAQTPADASHIKGSVEFKNVHFGYNPEKIIVNDFSAKIKPGQKVAIVGPTGAGKTTMVKLLMRFYDVTGGGIMIDGTDIRDFTRKDLRSMFGMVLQDTWLYNASIMENIRYGSFDATDEQIIEAAKAAHCHSFIHALPDGYNMVLNEQSSNISQGQKQLLTIARAILADPKILILDEATSSIDTRTEVLIQKAMLNLMQNRTSFVIAHRLSTIRDADLILVMKDGDIVEQGTHDELLEADGVYAGLYNSQFTGPVIEEPA